MAFGNIARIRRALIVPSARYGRVSWLAMVLLLGAGAVFEAKAQSTVIAEHIAHDRLAAQFPECTGGRIKRGNRCVCLSGWEWSGARCVRENCPPGMIGSPPNCQRAPNCTGGRTLRGGVCVCPPGLSWTGAGCTRPSCPPGQQGIPPNCRPITLNCPPGKIGRPPNCR